MGEGRKSRIQRPIIRSARTARGKLNGSRALEINTSALSRHLLFSRVLGKSRVSRRLLKKKKKKEGKGREKNIFTSDAPFTIAKINSVEIRVTFFFFFKKNSKLLPSGYF